MAGIPTAWRNKIRAALDDRDIELPALYDELTPAERFGVRERYVEMQGGACTFCKESLEGPPALEVQALGINWNAFPGDRSFLNYPVHLHHDHETGYTIGAVHAKCNAVLWQYLGE